MKTKPKICDHTFVCELEGTTVIGEHIHIYRCTKCGILDIGRESVVSEPLYDLD